MINTYNESALHRSLKNLYSIENNGNTEEKINNWICDIVTSKGNVIEIQTANISSLRNKIIALLNLNRQITVVHPIIVTKHIVTCSETGIVLLKRKSPKSETIYTMLKQLTGIWDLITKEDFQLELVYITCTEQRVRTETPVQLKNNSRRFYRNWIPREKKLETILSKQTLHTVKDYEILLPAALSDRFTATDLNKAIQSLPEFASLSKANLKVAAKQAHLVIWLLLKMKLIELAGKCGRSNLYKKTF